MVPAYLRIMQKIEVNKNGCWLFLGSTDGRGYGKISTFKIGKKHRPERVHRVMYETFIGKIPGGMVVRHKCDTKKCCNPQHLQLGTHEDNMQDLRDRYRRERCDAKETPF